MPPRPATGFTAAYYARQDRFARTEKYHGELERLARALGLAAGMRVLDIGCGTGRAAEYFEARTPCTVIRLDAPAGWLADPPATRAVRADGHQLPFAADTFDAVYLAHSIGHVCDPGRVLAEAGRVTRPGGRLALGTPNRAFVYALRPLNWLRIIRYVPDPTVVRVFSLRSLCATVRTAGWIIESAEYGGALPDYLRWLPRRGGTNRLRERLFLGARRGAVRGCWRAPPPGCPARARVFASPS